MIKTIAFTIILVVILAAAFVYFELYYLIRPSRLGKAVIKKHGFDYPVLIAHRGASYSAPESTAPAVKKAVESGIDFIELDVQRSKDGRLVIFHDENLLRLTDAEEVFPDRNNYDLRHFTFEDLKKLNYGAWFNRKYEERASDEYNELSILSLEEVIEIVKPNKSGVGLALELKSPYLYPGIERELIDILEDYQIRESELENPKVLFLSFSPASLRKLKDLRPNSPRVLLTRRNFAAKGHWKGWMDLTEKVADGIAPKGHVTFPWYIGAAHKRELFVFPYVINRSWQLKVLSWFSSDGYITDRPQLLSQFFNRVREINEKAEEFSEEMFSD